MNFQPKLITKQSRLGKQMIDQYYEQCNLFGYSFQYLQAKELKADKIFNESTQREFLEENAINIFVNKDEDSEFAGSELFSSFGYTSSYTNTFYIPVKTTVYFDFIPQEGDLMYDNTMDVLYEITKVDTLNETQSNLRVGDLLLAYKVYAKTYTYSYKDNIEDSIEEDINGIEILEEELDKLNATLQQDIVETNVMSNDRVDNIFGEY